jgi:hypothetical protein
MSERPLTPWSDAQRADSAVCAAVLSTAWVWCGLTLMCGLAGLSLVWRAGPLWSVAASLPVWLGVAWLAMRVAVDARLFTCLAQADGVLGDAAGLDGALMRAVGRPPAERDLTARIGGAMRLYRQLVALSLVHAVAVLVLLVWTMYQKGWMC